MPNINKLIDAGQTESFCKKCERILPLSEFLVSKQWINYCNDCNKNKLNSWRKNNPEKVRSQSQRNHAKNKEKMKKTQKKWKLENQERIRKYEREYYKKSDKMKMNLKFYTRLKTDPIFRIKNQMRTDVNKKLKQMFGSHNNRPHKLVGCSLSELKLFLESKFKPGMSWENYGGWRYNSDGTKRTSWEVDHIIPMFSAKTKEEMYALCHHTNLQPLWWWENVEKEKIEFRKCTK